MLSKNNSSLLTSHGKNYAVGDLWSFLSGNEVANLINDLGFSFRERIFSPMVTLFAFLSQVLSDDPSSRKAVLEVIALRIGGGLPPCCLNTGSFTKAKARLPLEIVKELVRRLAKALAGRVPNPWTHGRVLVVDGTGFAMPDSTQNRDMYPEHYNRKTGFPLGRLLGVFSLASGCLLDLAIAPLVGKGTGELTLLKGLWKVFNAGDTLLGDCLFSSFGVIVSARTHGCHVVAELRKDRHRLLNNRKTDQIIEIKKPRQKPLNISQQEFDEWPPTITVRVLKVCFGPKGFRVRRKYILTTHLDSEVVSGQDIADLYRKRWQVEINLRSIKIVLGMDMLRSKSPDMVEKEIWIHMLAYNLIREKMALAAATKFLPPEQISFRATQQLFTLLRTINSVHGKNCKDLEEIFLVLISSQVVGKRPNRFEPRATKRRKKNYALLSTSREEAKTKLHKKYKKLKNAMA